MSRLRHGKAERPWPVSFSESASGAWGQAQPRRQDSAAADPHSDQFKGTKTTPVTPPGLVAIQRKIAAVLSIRPECFITHPAELALLKKLSAAELEQFASENGWSTVSRVGGRQIEFYNDVGAKLATES